VVLPMAKFELRTPPYALVSPATLLLEKKSMLQFVMKPFW
jgi:hypothetical protein